MPPKDKNEQQFALDIAASIERLRGLVRTRLEPRFQGELFEISDRIQQIVLRRDVDTARFQEQVQNARDVVRRGLRSQPSDMVQFLNELESIEKSVLKLLS